MLNLVRHRVSMCLREERGKVAFFRLSVRYHRGRLGQLPEVYHAICGAQQTLCLQEQLPSFQQQRWPPLAPHDMVTRTGARATFRMCGHSTALPPPTLLAVVWQGRCAGGLDELLDVEVEQKVRGLYARRRDAGVRRGAEGFSL